MTDYRKYWMYVGSQVLAQISYEWMDSRVAVYGIPINIPSFSFRFPTFWSQICLFWNCFYYLSYFSFHIAWASTFQFLNSSLTFLHLIQTSKLQCLISFFQKKWFSFELEHFSHSQFLWAEMTMLNHRPALGPICQWCKRTLASCNITLIPQRAPWLDLSDQMAAR